MCIRDRIAGACGGDSPGVAPAPDASSAPTENGSPEEVELTRADDPGCPTDGEELETALLYIEHNATDEDTGVHGLFGGEAWSELCIWDPDGTLIFVFDPRNELDDLTVADVFFESREPENAEVAVAELRTRFPEGEYLVGGTDFEGTPRVAAASFTHSIAAEPEIISPSLFEDPEEADAFEPVDGLRIAWEPVSETIDGEPVSISAYEIIVTKEEHEDPDANSRPVYDVHVGPDFSSLSVPPEFYEPDTIYELEVIAIEASGNQTIGLGFFRTG